MATDLLKSQEKIAVPVRGPKRQDLPPMQAVAWYGKRDMRAIEAPRPAIADPRDAVLRVTSTAICGSDLHIYEGAFPRAAMQKGDIMGHEFMGIVEEVGSDVQHIKVGQRVIACFDIACGSCAFCKRQEFTCCDMTNPSDAMEAMYGDRTGGFFGYSHMTGGYDGGQADYVRVPFAEQNLLVLDEDRKASKMHDLDVLFLSDILPTAWHANELGEVSRGDVVCIWGAGPVGILAAHCAQHRGASKVILIDKCQYRLDFAQSHLDLNTLHTINRSDVSSVSTAIREVVSGGPDVCIEAVGFHYAEGILHKAEMALSLETDPSNVLNEIIVSCRKGGRIGVVGAYLGYSNHFNIGALMEKGLSLRAGQTPVQKYWHLLLDKVKSGDLRPRMVVTHELPLSEGPKGFKLFNDKDKDEACIKVVLHPRSYYEDKKTSATTTTSSKSSQPEEMSA